MLSNFFIGFDTPSIFDLEGMNKRNKKFEKHLKKQSNFLKHWAEDFDLFPLQPQPSPAEIKEAKLANLKRQEKSIQERKKAMQQYLEDLQKQEESITAKHEKLSKMEIQKEDSKKGTMNRLFGSEDEVDKLFEEFTKPQKEVKKNKKENNQMEEEKKDSNESPELQKDQNQPPELQKEQSSIARQEQNSSKLEDLKEKLAKQGFKCKENESNDDKHWIVGKKKFLNEKNQKEKQVFYQIHDKVNPNCNYSGYSKQIHDDAGNYSTVKKSVYHYENL